MESKKRRAEWEDYAVGEPCSNPNRPSASCYPLDTIYHVAHVSDAFRIFEDKRIRATLVGDESRLKKTRSSVTWLSPNTWANGSFYGNIRFDFDWKKLVEGKRFYWVEAMKYSPIAYRILITDDKPSLDLERYHPEEGNGPLYFDTKSDTWYCNIDNLTGEFMLDSDLWLDECETVAFENHHPRTCKRRDGHCRQLGRERYEAGAKLLSRLIGQNVLTYKEPLRRLFLEDDRLHSEAETAWSNIIRSFLRIEADGSLTHKDDAASPIMSAMLDRYGTKRSTKQLGSLFRSREELELALRHRLAKGMGVPVGNVTSSEEEL
jgi:hypothetical protein